MDAEHMAIWSKVHTVLECLNLGTDVRIFLCSPVK
jgi:hypothetical protein